MQETLNHLWLDFLEMLPKAIGVIIVLAVGWVAGRLLGKGLSKILDKIGVDDALRKTVVGKALEKSGVTCVRFFDLIIRWFVYLIAILAAVNILEIEVLSTFMTSVVEYLPNFIAGIFLLFIGLIVADFIGDAVNAVGREAKIEFVGLLANGLKLFLYLIVIVLALTVMKIDVSILYTFANALAWGIAIGVCIGLGIAFGWGFKDTVAKNAEKWIESVQRVAKKAEDFWSWYTHKEETESEG
ncbi:MAG: hypothetical protein QXN87_01215 [Candidatus Bathyarchaeia archaeon]